MTIVLEALAREVIAARKGRDRTAKLERLASRLQEIEQERAEHQATIERARAMYAVPSDDDLEIDDEPLVSVAEKGTWVAAWVWVPRAEDEDEG